MRFISCYIVHCTSHFARPYIVGFYVLSDAVKIEKLTGHVNVIRKTAKYLGNILTLRQEKLRT